MDTDFAVGDYVASDKHPNDHGYVQSIVGRYTVLLQGEDYVTAYTYALKKSDPPTLARSGDGVNDE